MLFLLTTHIRPIIEYCSCIWNTGYQGDLRLLESVQRRWTKQIESLEGLEYGDRLRALNLYSLQGRLIRADLIMYWKIFNGKSVLLPTDLFKVAPQRGTRGHCYKIFVPTTHTDIRKRFFNVRCIPTWNSLPQHVVTAASLSCFKKLLAEEMGDALFDYVPWCVYVFFFSSCACYWSLSCRRDPTVLRLQHYRQTIVYSQKLGIVYTVELNEDANIQPLASCICILTMYTGLARLFV